MPTRKTHPLDLLNIRQATNDVLESIAKEGTKVVVSEVLKAKIGEAAVSMAAEVASTATLSVVRPLLKIILQSTDASSRDLKKLIGLPLETGIRVAHETLEMTNEAGGEIWRQRANLATCELEKAYTLSERPMKARIRLIQGLLAVEMGEKGYANKWLGEFISFFEEQIEALYEPCRKLRINGSRRYYTLDPITRAVYIKDGGSQDQYERECAEDLEKADALEKQIDSDVADARQFVKTLRLFCQHE